MELFYANKILENGLFKSSLKKINELEKDRIFCRHGIDHLLDTGRIALIMCMKNGIKADEDVIYSAALLHDIGRAEEYTKGISHQLASVEIGKKILDETGAEDNFKKQVLNLIGSHRNKNFENSLEEVFSMADKKSRRCFMCHAKDKCKWNDEKKNLILEV